MSGPWSLQSVGGTHFITAVRCMRPLFRRYTQCRKCNNRPTPTSLTLCNRLSCNNHKLPQDTLNKLSLKFTPLLRQALNRNMSRKFRIPGLSFSWKRAIGLSGAKAKLSRSIGIPLTRSGRQRKVGKALGCCVPIALLIGGVSACAFAAKFFLHLQL